MRALRSASRRSAGWPVPPAPETTRPSLTLGPRTSTGCPSVHRAGASPSFPKKFAFTARTAPARSIQAGTVSRCASVPGGSPGRASTGPVTLTSTRGSERSTRATKSRSGPASTRSSSASTRIGSPGRAPDVAQPDAPAARIPARRRLRNRLATFSYGPYFVRWNPFDRKTAIWSRVSVADGQNDPAPQPAVRPCA